MLWYVENFTNHSGLCTVVEADSEDEARRMTTDFHYGRPRIVRPATEDDTVHFLRMGGAIR